MVSNNAGHGKGIAKLSPNAIEVLKKRYLKRDESGNVIESPEEMFWRVAKNISLMDIFYDKRVHTGVKPGKSKTTYEKGFMQAETPFEWELSQWDWQTLEMAFCRLEKKGMAKISWEQMKELIKNESSRLSSLASGFYELMLQGEFMPNSPALINAGRNPAAFSMFRFAY